MNEYPEHSWSCMDLYVRLRLESSQVSKHLQILKRANLVISQKNGKFIKYSINYDTIKCVEKLIQIFNDEVYNKKLN